MLRTRFSPIFGLLLAACPLAAQRPSAADLLAEARAAFARNLEQQAHWNWTTTESHSVIDGSGQVLQRLPAMVVESVVRKDGRRCNPVLSWGDGMEPYMLNADAETRCGGENPLETPFNVESLLKSARVKLAGHANSGVTLLIEHDKSRVHAAEQDVRCTASIQATVRLDPATHFPMHLEGEVVDSGCEGDTTPVLHYGEDAPKGRTHRMLHKGTTFRLEYSLEPDKFGNPAHSYWIAVEQHWSRPILRGAGAVIYGNRKFGLAPVVPNRRMLQDSQTAAREFGSESVTRFDTAK